MSSAEDDADSPRPARRAHTGLGHAHRILGNDTDARRHYQQALTLYTEIGMPQAEQIRTDLAMIDQYDRDR